jgi:hypothetical protein
MKLKIDSLADIGHFESERHTKNIVDFFGKNLNFAIILSENTTS